MVYNFGHAQGKRRRQLSDGAGCFLQQGRKGRQDISLDIRRACVSQASLRKVRVQIGWGAQWGVTVQEQRVEL